LLTEIVLNACRGLRFFLIKIFFFLTGKDYEHWRIPGVLQRFALSYLVVALLNVWLSPEEERVDVGAKPSELLIKRVI